MRAVPVVPAPSAIRAARVPAATRKCRLCSEVIHASERTCPHCGGVLFGTKPKKLNFTGYVGTGFGLVFLLMGFATGSIFMVLMGLVFGSLANTQGRS